MNKGKEQESSSDKKLSLVLLIVAIVAILIIVLVNIPWGGSGAKVAKDYEYLKNDNVFVTIKSDKLKEKIEKGETFFLYIGSNKLNDADYFVYYADQLAKQYGVSEIFYLPLNKMTTSDLEFVRENSIVELSVEVPNLIYFVGEGNLNEASKCYRISSVEDIDKYYGSNYWLLLQDFFKNCVNASK